MVSGTNNHKERTIFSTLLTSNKDAKLPCIKFELKPPNIYHINIRSINDKLKEHVEDKKNLKVDVSLHGNQKFLSKYVNIIISTKQTSIILNPTININSHIDYLY